MSKLIEVKDSKEFITYLDDITKKDQLMVLDFWGSICPPCKKLLLFLQEIVEKEQKYNNVLFLKVSVENDECEELFDKFEIKGIPRVIIFKGNKIIKDITGFYPDQLVKTLDEHSK
jgi:thioredoxin-like negative regulator of GroEL